MKLRATVHSVARSFLCGLRASAPLLIPLRTFFAQFAPPRRLLRVKKSPDSPPHVSRQHRQVDTQHRTSHLSRTRTNQSPCAPTNVTTLRYLTADVFTSAPFSGNQLAVVFGADGLPTETLQNIAIEFNYSETVFVFPARSAAETRHVRIFTPARELQFAGHPTIGTAHALVATGEVPATGDAVTVILGEGVGPVPVRVTLKDGKPISAQLTTAILPEERPTSLSIETVAEIVSLSPDDLIGGDYAPAGVSVGLPFLLVPLRSIDAVKRARVNISVWEQHLKGDWASEPMVFAVANDPDDASLPAHVQGCDVRARAFVPGLSVPEDPATGSANACLAGYLAKRTPRDGLLQWEVAQGIEMGRASRLLIEAEKLSGALTAIRVAGSTVLMAEGTLSFA